MSPELVDVYAAGVVALLSVGGGALFEAGKNQKDNFMEKFGLGVGVLAPIVFGGVKLLEKGVVGSAEIVGIVWAVSFLGFVLGMAGGKLSKSRVG